MLQKSGYGIVIRVLSTSQCSAVLLSQYNPPFLPLQNPQRWSAATYLMNSKRWLFPCLFRVFVIQISVNTQGSVKVAQAVPQHLSQDWERDSQLTKVDHTYSLLYKSRYVYNTSVPRHVVRIAWALALKLPVFAYFGTLGHRLAYLPFRVWVPMASHPRCTPLILSLPHPHTHTLSLFLSLTHSPFISILFGDWMAWRYWKYWQFCASHLPDSIQSARCWFLCQALNILPDEIGRASC